MGGPQTRQAKNGALVIKTLTRELPNILETAIYRDSIVGPTRGLVKNFRVQAVAVGA